MELSKALDHAGRANRFAERNGLCGYFAGSLDFALQQVAGTCGGAMSLSREARRQRAHWRSLLSAAKCVPQRQ